VRLAAICISTVLLGCGGGTEGRHGDTVLSDAARDWDQNGLSGSESTRFAESPADAPRPLARRRSELGGSLSTHVVDVRFDDADLHNALRFLADEAGVSLVIGDGVGGRVDERLERVDAYEALVTLARAHGATVERQGRVVIVRAP
jgi:hypothetical protein